MDLRLRVDLLLSVCRAASHATGPMGHLRRLHALHAQTRPEPPTPAAAAAALEPPKYALPPIALTPDRDLLSSSS